MRIRLKSQIELDEDVIVPPGEYEVVQVTPVAPGQEALFALAGEEFQGKSIPGRNREAWKALDAEFLLGV